ncbi:hypothetical protein, partial [Halomonas llamarensis]|nr:hypothetical protein [Halomonas llamarensis]
MNNDLTLSVTLTGDGRQLSGTLRNAQGEVREFGGTTEREGARAERALEGTGQQAQTVSGHLSQLRTVALGVGAALTAMGVSSFAKDTYDAVNSSQQLQASLKTVTGSIENASAAWDTLLGFAAETPFTLDQSVQAFIRMQSLGLNPSQEALRSYGNTAAAMGKDMMQMVEAVADAATGEFERLKEFGIRASKEGEQISFTFQGVTTTVGNSAAAISQYLQEIGEIQFAGAMADQMDTLSGKASNLEDTIYQFYLAVGDAGATEIFESTLANASNTVQFLTDNIDALASGAEIMAVLVGGRVSVALTTATTAIVAKTVATQADVSAEAAAAVANTRRTAAEKQTALALLSTARLEAQATSGTAAHTFALQQLSVARTRAATAAGAHTAAMNTATAATARASVAARGLSGALALVGGPLGLLVGGAGLLYLFREELGLTVPTVDANTTAVNKLTNGLDDMSQAAAQLTLTSLVGQLAEVRAQAEATAEEFSKVGQIEGDGGGGILGVDVTAQTDAVRELGETSDETRQEAANLEAAIALVEGRIGELGERNREVEPTITKVGDANETAATATNTHTDALEDLQNRLQPMRRETVQYAQAQNTLNLALATGRINAQQYMQMQGLLNETFQQSQRESEDLATTVGDEADRMATLYNRQLERMDDASVDMWRSFLDGSEDAFGSFKRLALDTLAEVIHQYTTRQITASLGFNTVGAGGGQPGGMGMPSIGGIKNAWGAAQQGFGNIAWTGASHQAYGATSAATGGWANSATSGMGQSGFMGGSTSNFSGMNGLASAGAGMAGSYAGTQLGESVFGKQAQSNYGATAGSLIGTYFGGPIGAGIGGFIGGALDSAFGSNSPAFKAVVETVDTAILDVAKIQAEVAADGIRAVADKYAVDTKDIRRAMNDSYFEGGNDAEYYEQSAFGAVGFRNRTSRDFGKAGLDDGWWDEITQGAAQLDNVVASFAQSEDEFSAMLETVQSMGLYAENAGELIQFALQERPRAAIDAMTSEFGQYVQSLDGSLDAVIAQAQVSQQAHALLSNSMERLNLQFDVAGQASYAAAVNIAEIAGGVQNLTTIQQSYYQATYTETERLSRSQSDLRKTLAGVTDQVPTTVAELRAMVEAQNLNDTATGELAVRLMELAPALKQTNDAVRQAIEEQYQESLGRAPDTAGIDYWFNQVAS